MLTRWYLQRQLGKLRQDQLPFAFASPSALLKTAALTRFIFTSSELFYAGQPLVRQFFAVEDQTMATKEKVMLLAASLAAAGGLGPQQAVVQAAEEAGLTLREVEVDRLGRAGVIGKLDRTWYLLGDQEILQEEQIDIGLSVQRLVHQLEKDGLYSFFLAQKQPKRLLGVFACEYPAHPQAPEVIRQLEELGIEPVLLSSAKQTHIKGLAKKLGIQLLHTELSEREKHDVLKQLFAQQPHSAVVSTRVSASDKAPFQITIASRPQPVPVWAQDLTVLPTVVEEAHNIVRRLRSRFFWVTLKS